MRTMMILLKSRACRAVKQNGGLGSRLRRRATVAMSVPRSAATSSMRRLADRVTLARTGIEAIHRLCAWQHQPGGKNDWSNRNTTDYRMDWLGFGSSSRIYRLGGVRQNLPRGSTVPAPDDPVLRSLLTLFRGALVFQLLYGGVVYVILRRLGLFNLLMVLLAYLGPLAVIVWLGSDREKDIIEAIPRLALVSILALVGWFLARSPN